jgi:hypothetical protein
MSLRRPANVDIIMNLRGASNVLAAMKKHPDAVLVQRQGCLAIRNMVARGQEWREMIMELGAEEMLRSSASE